MLTMSRRILYMVLGGIIALAVVGAAVVGGTAVFAQDDATPTPPTEETEPIFPGRGFRDFNGERPDFDEFRGQGMGPQMGRMGDQSYLADALGIAVEELQAAQEAVRTAQREDAVAQALADGLITQEQADAILSGEDFGRGFGMRGFGKLDLEGHNELLAAELGISVEELDAAHEAARETALAQALADGLITQEQIDMMATGEALRDYIDHDELLASVLGLSTDEVAAAREDGSIRDLVAESGLTSEEFMTAMQEAHETAVAQAVADGVITQEQADQLQAAPGRGFNGPCGGHGHHGRGGFGGPRSGGFGSGAPNSDAPANSDTTNTSNA